MTGPRTAVLAVLLAVTGLTHAAEDSPDFGVTLETVESQLAATPDDPWLRFRRAQLLGNLGRDDEALSVLDVLRSEHPNDVDYAFARARILGRNRRTEEALEELRIATSLAPNYEDVWRFRLALLERDDADASEVATLRGEAAARFPHSTWWQEPPPPAPVWSLTAGTQFEELTGGRPGWNNQTFEVSRSDERIGTLRASLMRSQRDTNLEDFGFTLGAERRWSEEWFGGVDVTFGGSADFLPETGFSMHVGRILDHGWVANLRYRRREFASVTTDTALATLERYFGSFRFAYSLNVSQLNGSSTSTGHVGTLNWYYRDTSNVGISIAAGNEIEAIDNGDVLETSVDGASLTGRHALSDRFAVLWWLGTHRQGDFYRRRFVGMAVSFRI